MSQADALMAEWLRKIRAVLYKETLPEPIHYTKSAPYFEEVHILKQAVTWPAVQCQGRGWKVPSKVFTDLITKTLRKVVAQARTPFTEMHCRAAYFMKALQDEFQHNWDQYWDQSKIATAAEVAAAELAQRRGEIRSEPIEDTQAILAQAHALLQNRGGRPKKAAKPEPAPAPKKLAPREIQSELF